MAHNLPNLVKPTHYDVTLYNFDFERFTFSGDVTIRFGPTSVLNLRHSLEELDTLEDKIVLNSYELKIHEAVIRATQTKTESTVKAVNISYDEKARTATLDFGQKILHDNKKSFLSIKFDGILNNAMAGFYRSAYEDGNGEKKYMFSTQCEV
jgi:aminopeptidase N